MDTPLIALGIGICVFVICRELICWYWKINEQTELLKSTDNKLEKLISS